VASITIKNVPTALLERIRQRAAANRRSMNREIIHQLEAAYPADAEDTDQILAEIAELHRLWKGPPLTADEIRAAIDEGRA
jgi:antitoxin FitA